MYLGIDFGTKKIGIATGQEITQTATPLKTLFAKQGEPDWEGLQAIVETWRPLAVVIGCALNQDLTESATSLKARAFGEAFKKRFKLPVHFVDEHLTTFEARLLLKEKPQSKFDPDAMAAKLILETWLRGERAFD